MPRSLEDILARADELADRFEAFDPDPLAPAVLKIRAAARRRTDADRDLMAAVAAARSAGVSWALIGRELGTTGEAARQRYGRLVSP